MLNKTDEFIFKLEDIENIEITENYVNMVDIKVEEDESFVLSNGIVSHNSALGGLVPVLGRKDVGYFPLRGKPLNTQDINVSKILANEELKNIISIMGIDISEDVTDMDFENILIASDQDLDGILIRGLCVTFFQKYTPSLLSQGRIKYLKTPMIVLQKKKKIEHWFFNFTEYNDWLKENSVEGYDFKYYKGLGTWKPDDLKYIIEKVGLEKITESFEFDENATDSIKHWMGNSFSDKRKELLRGKEFNIEKI